MAVRLIHDTAFGIASVLTERMDYKLIAAEREAFHRLVYETCKAALQQYDVQRDREKERVGSPGRET